MRTANASLNDAECAAEVVMVTADEAARVAHVGTRTIYRWIEIGKVHFAETQQRLLLVSSRLMQP